MDRFVAYFGAAVAMAVAAVILFASAPSHHAHVWAVVLAAGAAAVMLVAAGDLFLTRPRLVLDDPHAKDRPIINTSLGLEPDTEGYHGGTIGVAMPAASAATGASYLVGYGKSASFAYLRVWNKPRLGGKEAKNVTCRLTFLDAAFQLLHEIDGRWSATPQHRHSELTLRAHEATIAKTTSASSAHVLDIAMKYPDEDECYAFNEENRFVDPKELRHHALGAPPVHVKVEVFGSNARRVTANYVLTTADDGRLQIEAWT
jgi:hypothetical protein